MQRRCELVLVSPRLGFDRVCHCWLRHPHRLKKDLMRLIAERVASQSDSQFGYCAEIPRMQLGHLNCLTSLHDREMRQPLRFLTGKVQHWLIGLHHAADDLKE